MSAVRGVLLDESILFAEDSNGNTFFQSGAEVLLGRLQYSKLRTGVSYQMGVSAQKVTFLKEMASLYSLDCFMLNASSIDASLNEILLAWGDIGGSCLYVASCKDEDLFLKLRNHGWLTVVKSTGGGDATENLTVMFMNKLEELPFILCRLSRKVTADNIVRIGYIMKPSREEDFAKRGAFPMYPTQNGLMFVPFTFNLPLVPQVQEVDVVLHKATDEIITIDLGSSEASSNRICYSKGMEELRRYVQGHTDCCLIDPFDNIYPVVDRLKIQHVLLGLEDLNKEGRCRIRGPHFLKVDSFNEPDLAVRLSEAKLLLPSIVKPQVACGVADAHNMAIVFRTEDFQNLNVPLPAVIQICRTLRGEHIRMISSECSPHYVDHLSLKSAYSETQIPILCDHPFFKHNMYHADVDINLQGSNGFPRISANQIVEYVDHSALLFKFYVLGDKVFHAVKNSTPNADVFLSSYEKEGLKPISFNSLKSLPIAKESQQSGAAVRSKADKNSLDLELVIDAANWLRSTLDLTIFGFDVVVQEGSRDHVIVDVNYLPSFKEVPNDVAIPAFWDAIKNVYESRR